MPLGPIKGCLRCPVLTSSRFPYSFLLCYPRTTTIHVYILSAEASPPRFFAADNDHPATLTTVSASPFQVLHRALIIYARPSPEHRTTTRPNRFAVSFVSGSPVASLCQHLARQQRRDLLYTLVTSPDFTNHHNASDPQSPRAAASELMWRDWVAPRHSHICATFCVVAHVVLRWLFCFLIEN